MNDYKLSSTILLRHLLLADHATLCLPDAFRTTQRRVAHSSRFC